MSIFSLLKEWLKGLTAPAKDPRLTYADAFQRHRELMGRVRRARGKLSASKKDLETRLTEARSRQQRLEMHESQDAFVMQLRQIVGEELRFLEAEVRELDQEEKELAMVEQRLSFQEEAFTARQEALGARYSAAEARVRIHKELGGVSEDLADLGVALEKAEQRTEEIQARASAIDHLAELGILEVPGHAAGANAAQHLADRYTPPELKGLQQALQVGFSRIGSTNGLKALQQLAYEYGQLQLVLDRRKGTDPLSFAHIPPLVEETYHRGMSVLEDALGVIRVIRGPDRERLEAEIIELEKEIESLRGDETQTARVKIREETLASHRERLDMIKQQQFRIDELLHQAGRCEASLRLTRMELAALKVDSSEASVSAATDTLRKTISQAREVQEELKRLGF